MLALLAVLSFENVSVEMALVFAALYSSTVDESGFGKTDLLLYKFAELAEGGNPNHLRIYLLTNLSIFSL